MDETQAYEGSSERSFEDAVTTALADVPPTNVPVTYDVRLRYVSPGGVTGAQEFRAVLRRAGSLEESGESPVR